MTRRLHGLLFGAAASLAAGCYSDDDGDNASVPDPSTSSDAQVAADAAAGDASAPPRDAGSTDCSRLTDPIQRIACSLGLGRDSGTGFQLPGAAQCRNPRDPITEAICRVTMPRRDAGTPRDAGADGGRRDGGTDASVDAAVSDAEVTPDAAPPDAAIPDAAPADAAVDAAEVDAAEVDAAEPDASEPDASVADDAAADPDAAIDPDASAQ